MYGLPDPMSGEERRARFEQELYDSSRLMRAAGRPVFLVGIILWVAAIAAEWGSLTGALGGIVTGLGLVMMAIGSRWLARRQADSVYRVR